MKLAPIHSKRLKRYQYDFWPRYQQEASRVFKRPSQKGEAALFWLSKYHLSRLSLWVEGDCTMAKKGGFSSMEFVSVNLSAEQKKEFARLWEKETDMLRDMFVTCLEKGYKINPRYDERNNSFACFTTTSDETNVNYGTGFSTYAGDPFQAMFLAAWKIMVVCDGGLWENSDAHDFG